MKLEYFSEKTDKKIDWEKVDPEGIERLDKARHLAGVPFKITSHYRSPQKSKTVGGSLTDAHTRTPCNAFDIAVPTVDDPPRLDTAALYHMVTGIYDAGFPRIGINPFNFHIHTDLQDDLPSPRLWIETPESLIVRWLEARGYTVTKKSG